VYLLISQTQTESFCSFGLDGCATDDSISNIQFLWRRRIVTSVRLIEFGSSSCARHVVMRTLLCCLREGSWRKQFNCRCLFVCESHYGRSSEAIFTKSCKIMDYSYGKKWLNFGVDPPQNGLLAGIFDFSYIVLFIRRHMRHERATYGGTAWRTSLKINDSKFRWLLGLAEVCALVTPSSYTTGYYSKACLGWQWVIICSDRTLLNR